MNIIVSKDIVKLNENHSENHYGEYNVNECVFEFDEYFDSVPIKKAIFTSQSNNKSFEIDIINNKCTVPHEVLTKVYDTVILGVYGYDVNEETLLVRYSPEPTTFVVHEGSYREGAEQPEIITPTQYDIYSKALQEGLAEVDKRLDDVEKQGDYASEQGDYAKEQGDYAKSEGDNAKSVAEETEKKAQEGAFDGKSLEFVWEGTKLGVRLEGQEEYHFVDLQGVQGEIGATGEPFKIKKTYASVSEMNADFGNMQFGDYVMIASSVNEEDNAKLYTRGESAWIFISDFSGAMGIRGETGLTPNIQIGEVKTLEPGSQVKVTRSGSNEEPVFNFEIPKGDKGDGYVLTEEDKVEIGEKVNTEYEERIEQNEKYISDLEATIDILTNTNKAKGELVHIEDALNLPTKEVKVAGAIKQETTKGNQLLDINTVTPTDATISDGIITSKTLGDWGTITWKFPNIPLSRTIYYVSFDLRIKSGTCKRINKLNMWESDIFVQNYDFIVHPTPSNIYQRYCIKFDLTNNTTLYNLNTINIQVADDVVDAILEVKDIMLSTSSDYTYEKFTNGASPNPEYPQEIEVLEGNVGIKVNGNNLVKYTAGTITKNGITANISRNGITLNGTATDNTFIVFHRTTDSKILKDKIFNIKEGKSGVQVYVDYINDDNSWNSSQSASVNGTKISPATETMQFTIKVDKDTTLSNYVVYPMISLEGGEYEPYKEQIATIDLQGNELVEGDELVVDKKGNVSLVKNIGKWVFNGNEYLGYTNGVFYTTNLNDYYLSNGTLKCLSNYYVGFPEVNGSSIAYNNGNNSIALRNKASGSSALFIRDDRFTIVEDFKANLKEKYDSGTPVIVYYQLAEPQTIYLGELPEPIKTFEGTNNIQVLANLDTEIEVKYALDLKKYYDNKLAEISAQII